MGISGSTAWICWGAACWVSACSSSPWGWVSASGASASSSDASKGERRRLGSRGGWGGVGDVRRGGWRRWARRLLLLGGGKGFGKGNGEVGERVGGCGWWWEVAWLGQLAAMGGGAEGSSGGGGGRKKKEEERRGKEGGGRWRQRLGGSGVWVVMWWWLGSGG
nr:heterogeneous nuclear ribonucleoprotein A1-like [Arachis hypogaea]